jgi:hypothetical protein
LSRAKAGGWEKGFRPVSENDEVTGSGRLSGRCRNGVQRVKWAFYPASMTAGYPASPGQLCTRWVDCLRPQSHSPSRHPAPARIFFAPYPCSHDLTAFFAAAVKMPVPAPNTTGEQGAVLPLRVNIWPRPGADVQSWSLARAGISPAGSACTSWSAATPCGARRAMRRRASG